MRYYNFTFYVICKTENFDMECCHCLLGIPLFTRLLLSSSFSLVLLFTRFLANCEIYKQWRTSPRGVLACPEDGAGAFFFHASCAQHNGCNGYCIFLGKMAFLYQPCTLALSSSLHMSPLPRLCLCYSTLPTSRSFFHIQLRIIIAFEKLCKFSPNIVI